MELGKHERDILKGRKGEGMKKALEILIILAEIHNAKRLIPITSAQISGVSYKTIGDAGLEFLKDMAEAEIKVNTPSTLNPAGVDFTSELKFPEDFVEKQREIIDTYTKMGILPSCTCTPYYAGNLPRMGDHIAWAESSAVIYANSVLGAMTNRESALSALSAALVGKVPDYGLHMKENRAPTLLVEVEYPIINEADYAALGYHIGQNYEGIPYFRIRKKPRAEDLKTLGAALATGQVSMFHYHNITPEASHYPIDKIEKVELGQKEVSEAYEKLNSTEDVDIIAVGCPHAGITEILDVIKADPKREVWVFTSKNLKELFKDRIDNENIKLIADTCMVVSPIEKMGIKSIGVNSAKAAFYSMNLSNLKVKFDSLENLLKE